MHTPIAPRPPSASTALSVASSRPPRRRRSGAIVATILVVLVVVGVAGAVVAARGPLEEVLDNVGIERTADTEEVDEPTERVPVSTHLAGGVRWTMQDEPRIEDDLENTTTWVTETLSAAESVTIADDAPFLDASVLIEQAATALGGGVTVGAIEEHVIAGQDASTAMIRDFDVEGTPGVGRATVVSRGDDRVVVLALGEAARETTIVEQHLILVASLRFD